MKVVILAGGFGTRISEETSIKPKPMIEIGDKPILWHIMKHYSYYGFDDFIICLGYKGYVIKEYFYNYYIHQSNLTIDLGKNQVDTLESKAESWRITLVDTGINSMTGERIKRIKDFIKGERFLLTYGDGLSNVNISKLVDFHLRSKKIITVTAVQPMGRFGALNINNENEVTSFLEKPKGDGSWINGGFFVCEPDIFSYINQENAIWEKEPMEKIAEQGLMQAFQHDGFWKPMDTLRDKNELEHLWAKGYAPWKIWI